jgi:hypothetical protein
MGQRVVSVGMDMLFWLQIGEMGFLGETSAAPDYVS